MANLTEEIGAEIINYTMANLVEEVGVEEGYGVRPEVYIVQTFFGLIMLFGLISNSMLILIILSNKIMRNGINIFILSVAINDLMVVTICVPAAIIMYAKKSWTMGEPLCKIYEFLKDISTGVSVFTLTALSVDRHNGITNPLGKKYKRGERHTRHSEIKVMCLIWISAMILATPALFSYVKDFNESKPFSVCDPFPPEFGPYYPIAIVMFRFITNYALPFSISTISYIRMARHLVRSTKDIVEMHNLQVRQSRMRTAKTVVICTVIFALCFLPQYIFMMRFYNSSKSEEEHDIYFHSYRILGFGFSFINTCINPVALYFLSSNFKKYFNRFLFCCVKRRARRGRTESFELRLRRG